MASAIIKRWRDLEKLLLAGAGGFGRVVLEHASQKYECAFVDDGPKIGTEINGCKVLGRIADIEKLYGQYKLLIVTIGNNKLREKIYREAAVIGYSFPNIIIPSAYISPYATIGAGCVILNNVVIQNNAQVGNGVILNPGVEIHHDSVVGNNVLIYTNSVVRTFAKVGDRAHLGSTLTISNEVLIPDDSIIQDGETVIHYTPETFEPK